MLGLGTEIAVGRQISGTVPATNLEIMQNLLGRIAVEVAASLRALRGETIDLHLPGAKDDWIAENAMASALKGDGFSVYHDADSSVHPAFRFLVHDAGLQVEYDDMHRDGFLGARKVRRTISATLTCQVMRPDTREVVYSATPSLNAVDSIEVDEIPRLESDSIGATRGKLPSESFLDRIIEPAVIIGATGVAVYLFFHVRS